MFLNSQSSLLKFAAALITGAAMTVAVDAGAAARSTVLHLEVGKGISASVRTPLGGLRCSDQSQCALEVPANGTFEVVARRREAGAIRWTGCSPQREPGRCTVTIKGQPVHVSAE